MTSFYLESLISTLSSLDLPSLSRAHMSCTITQTFPQCSSISSVSWWSDSLFCPIVQDWWVIGQLLSSLVVLSRFCSPSLFIPCVADWYASSPGPLLVKTVRASTLQTDKNVFQEPKSSWILFKDCSHLIRLAVVWGSFFSFFPLLSRQALQEALPGTDEEACWRLVSAGRHAAGRPGPLSHGCGTAQGS